MLKDSQLETFRKLLEEEYDWPAEYHFKFVVPYDKVPEVEALFPNEKAELKASSKGNYVSVNIIMTLESADIVIAVYQQASQIKGLISL